MQRPVAMDGEARLHRASVFGTHVVAGALAGALVALLDLLHAGLSSAGTRVSPLEFLVAGLHVVSLYAPVGLLVGAALAVVALAVRQASWLGPLRTTLGTPEAWVARDPGAFAATAAFFLTAGILAVAGERAFVLVRTGVHRETLAGWAIGGIVAAALPLGVLLHALLTPPLTAIGWLLGRAATFATAVLGVAIAALAVLVVYLEHEPEVALAYPPATIAALPAAIVLYVASAILVERWLEERDRRTGTIAVAATILVTFVALLLSAATYGHSNRVRSVVEQRSVLGRRLVRLYASLSDRDGDRHPWAFGGGDCDDGDPLVHPGARDAAGDGVDADCFRGDGSPDVAPRGDGAFGTAPATLSRPSFLVVTIDALRRDHLASNGYARDTSPEIDRFLASAVDFEDVVPQSSRSLRSIPSMWTGLYPSEIAFGGEMIWPALLPQNVTAAELLQGHGYATSAVIATDYFERIAGFFQGFDEELQHGEPDPPRDWAVNEALPRLRTLVRGGRPWLLWVHLYNCHAPYLQDGAPSAFGGELVDLYDTEIGLAGAQFQRLLDELRTLGAESSTVVVLASDHGEGFGEHGTFNHSTTLYEEEMASLLAVRVPGEAPASVTGLVGLLDVMPTIANLAGTPLEVPVSGRSLVPAITGERAPDPDRTIFAELLPDGLAPYDIKVARRGDEKLLWWLRDGTYQYFDLATDPGERHDLSDDRREEADELLGELRAWVAHAGRDENRCDAFVAMNRLGAIPPSIDHRLDIRYDRRFTVLGFDLEPGPYHPGGTIPLTFYYRVDGETDRDLYFVADLLRHGPGPVLPPHFHAHHYPLHACYHTDDWRRGEILRDPTPIPIPADLAVPVTVDLVLTIRDGDVAVVEGSRGGETRGTFHLTEIPITPDPHAIVLPTAVAIDAGVDAPLPALEPHTIAPPALAPGAVDPEP